jgi:hypothetical protein
MALFGIFSVVTFVCFAYWEIECRLGLLGLYRTKWKLLIGVYRIKQHLYYWFLTHICAVKSSCCHSLTSFLQRTLRVKKVTRAYKNVAFDEHEYNCLVIFCLFNVFVFWVINPWRWKQYVSPKRWYLPTSPHGVTTLKTNIDTFIAVSISVSCLSLINTLSLIVMTWITSLPFEWEICAFPLRHRRKYGHMNELFTSHRWMICYAIYKVHKMNAQWVGRVCPFVCLSVLLTVRTSHLRHLNVLRWSLVVLRV